MKNIDIKNLFSLLRAFKRREFRTISSKARHDWKIMVVSFLFLAFVVIVGHFLFFRQIESGKIYTQMIVEDKSPVTVSKDTLEETVIFFGERKTHLDELQMGREVVTDPSL